jgi:hypothetical protein
MLGVVDNGGVRIPEQLRVGLEAIGHVRVAEDLLVQQVPQCTRRKTLQGLLLNSSGRRPKGVL